MSQDFTTRLQLELRAAAERQERGSVRVRLPRPGRPAVAALAVMTLVAVVLAGGVRWNGQDTITAPQVIGTYDLGDNLGSAAEGFGSVWITDRGPARLLRVDPETRKVTARTQVMPNALVSTGGGAVWVLGYYEGAAPEVDTLLRVDPETAEVTARTRLVVDGEPFPAGDVQVHDGEVWLLGRRGAVQIDPETGALGRLVPLVERAGDPLPLSLWITPDGLVALRREGRIERYDLRTGKLAGLLPVRLAGAQFLVPTPAGPVLSSPPGRIALAEPERGRIVWDREFTATAYPTLDGGRLWAFVQESGGERLYELSLRTGDTRSDTKLPDFFGPTDVTKSGRDLWITSQSGKVMIVRTPS